MKLDVDKLMKEAKLNSVKTSKDDNQFKTPKPTNIGVSNQMKKIVIPSNENATLKNIVVSTNDPTTDDIKGAFHQLVFLNFSKMAKSIN